MFLTCIICSLLLMKLFIFKRQFYMCQNNAINAKKSKAYIFQYIFNYIYITQRNKYFKRKVCVIKKCNVIV